MIIVAVEVKVKAGDAARAREAIAKMEAATRQEAGSVTRAFSVDINDDSRDRTRNGDVALPAFAGRIGTILDACGL